MVGAKPPRCGHLLGQLTACGCCLSNVAVGAAAGDVVVAAVVVVAVVVMTVFVVVVAMAVAAVVVAVDVAAIIVLITIVSGALPSVAGLLPPRSEHEPRIRARGP